MLRLACAACYIISFLSFLTICTLIGPGDNKQRNWYEHDGRLETR